MMGCTAVWGEGGRGEGGRGEGGRGDDGVHSSVGGGKDTIKSLISICVYSYSSKSTILGRTQYGMSSLVCLCSHYPPALCLV